MKKVSPKEVIRAIKPITLAINSYMEFGRGITYAICKRAKSITRAGMTYLNLAVYEYIEARIDGITIVNRSNFDSEIEIIIGPSNRVSYSSMGIVSLRDYYPAKNLILEGYISKVLGIKNGECFKFSDEIFAIKSPGASIQSIECKFAVIVKKGDNTVFIENYFNPLKTILTTEEILKIDNGSGERIPIDEFVKIFKDLKYNRNENL